jgi:hypothetical protein
MERIERRNTTKKNWERLAKRNQETEGNPKRIKDRIEDIDEEEGVLLRWETSSRRET